MNETFEIRLQLDRTITCKPILDHDRTPPNLTGAFVFAGDTYHLNFWTDSKGSGYGSVIFPTIEHLAAASKGEPEVRFYPTDVAGLSVGHAEISTFVDARTNKKKYGGTINFGIGVSGDVRVVKFRLVEESPNVLIGLGNVLVLKPKASAMNEASPDEARARAGALARVHSKADSAAVPTIKG